ncbi:MAG TPA: MFS transporter [Gammaproteobacteria bacterium]|nr:MFS transporter [Gammaproteobacteria bacterium]
MATKNQFQLLLERRFLPYFITQFLGAFNDNVYRISLMILIAVTYASAEKSQADYLVNLCAALFIMPFFLFSATAGQLADKYTKAYIIRWIKFSEVVMMLLAGFAFYLNSIYFLIVILFFMGTHSAFFGPIKYSILPQHLNKRELVGGNGLVEMGTFIAILLGTIVGGLLIGLEHYPKLAVSITTISVALLGFITSFFIPKIKSPSSEEPQLKIRLEPISETWKTLKIAASKRVIFLSILGTSWFWFYGTSFLTQLPNYNARFIHGNESVITLMLAAFSIGIGVGSMLCERLSGHKVEIGLVPFGAIGLTLFAADLSFAHGPFPEVEITVREFIQSPHNWRLLADLTLIGLFGGFYIVPLYVILQDRSKPNQRSRIIAANNIINSLLMALASVLAVVLLRVGLSIPEFFFVIALMNAAVTLYIFKVVPEFLMRFIIWILIHSLYRVEVEGSENLPEDGPAVLCCNHVSYLDPLIVMACVRKPIRFVMDYHIFKIPILSFVFKTAKCIPITPGKHNRQIKENAFKEVSKALKARQLVGIFPEGGLTPNGSVQPFKPGISKIALDNNVKIIPIALQGMWGSWYSRRHGRAMLHLPRKFIFAKVKVKVGAPIYAKDFDLQSLQQKIEELRGNMP